MPKMNNTESQMVAFNIISFSGMSRACIHEALEAMRQNDFELAKLKLKEADEQMVQAHQAQTDLLQAFAGGTEIEIQIIMVHAQDHLMTTMTLKEVAEEMMHLYQENSKVKDDLKSIKEALSA